MKQELEKSSKAADEYSKELEKNKENYFDINKNAESVVEKFTKMEERLGETEDALAKLNKELEKNGQQQKAQGEATSQQRREEQAARGEPLAGLKQVLEENLKLLRTYAFVE